MEYPILGTSHACHDGPLFSQRAREAVIAYAPKLVAEGLPLTTRSIACVTAISTVIEEAVEWVYEGGLANPLQGVALKWGRNSVRRSTGNK